MRRPVLYLAGLLMATGASLALAGPASAAAHDPHNCHHNYSNGYWDDDEDEFSYHSDYRYTHADSYNNGNTFNGINVLNGVIGGGLL